MSYRQHSIIILVLFPFLVFFSPKKKPIIFFRAIIRYTIVFYTSQKFLQDSGVIVIRTLFQMIFLRVKQNREKYYRGKISTIEQKEKVNM